MSENTRKLTNQELEEIALEVQSHTGLPFLDTITYRYLQILSSVEILSNTIDYMKSSAINDCIVLNHRFKNNPNIRKCYDW